MILGDNEFETGINSGDNFYIKIKQESDWSQDGGYTFEDVLNIYELDDKTARMMINELLDYIQRKSLTSITT